MVECFCELDELSKISEVRERERGELHEQLRFILPWFLTGGALGCVA